MTSRRAVLTLAVSLACAATLAAAAERCAVCGLPIEAGRRSYQTEDGREVYCERCFLSAPRCSRCDLPTAAEALEPASGLCSRCTARLPRCTACGKAIADTAYTLRFARGTFCAQCKANRPPCHVCGAPVGNEHWRFPDGRRVCGACGERAIVDPAEIRRIMQQTERIVRERLGLAVRARYELRIEKLADFRGRLEAPPAPDASAGGLYGKELGAYRRVNGRSEIVLLFGLPPELTFEAAAHEYAHAWTAENCPGLAADLREGFAQWVAADVLRVQGFRGALEKLESRTDAPYGTGYRRVRSMGRERFQALCRGE